MKSLLVLLFSLAKGAKFAKLFTTAGTMLLSVFAYAFVYGWRYAVGLVALLFAHEMGHFVAARQRGLAVGAPTFIPFMGAWIQLKEMPHDAETEAYVGINGPIAGSVAAFAVYLYARASGEEWLLALAYSGFFLNLFNLIPLSPLDGGRIVGVISPRLWLAGVPILVGVFLWHPSPLLVLIALLALPQLWVALKGLGEGQRADYYATALPVRIAYGAQYLFLVVTLAAACFEIHQHLGGA